MMKDDEKIKAAIVMLKQLKRMVGFFMKRNISDLIEKLENKDEINIRTPKASKSIQT
ncbi:MAG: hypothetical protein ACYCZO_15285 [Daejeonella sp.]